MASEGSGLELLVGGCTVIFRDGMVVIDGGEPIALTRRERQVFEVLVERPGVVYSKEFLLRSIWGRSEKDTHVVEVTVGRLRQRLGVAGIGVETVVRRGYRANVTSTAAP
jgi:DNA-binding response OmpR family regulator